MFVTSVVHKGLAKHQHRRKETVVLLRTVDDFACVLHIPFEAKAIVVIIGERLKLFDI